MAAFTYPLPIADFFDVLEISAFTLDVSEPMREARLGDGTILRASAGEALWKGSLTLRADRHLEAGLGEALLALTARPGASALIYDPRTSAQHPTASATLWTASTLP